MRFVVGWVGLQHQPEFGKLLARHSILDLYQFENWAVCSPVIWLELMQASSPELLVEALPAVTPQCAVARTVEHELAD